MNFSFLRRQLPPTAGLPLLWRDLSAPRADFSTRLAQELGIPPPLLPLFRYCRTDYCPALKIVPCDMEYGGINFDRERLAQLCDPQTLAVIVTHLAGRVADTATAIQCRGWL